MSKYSERMVSEGLSQRPETPRGMSPFKEGKGPTITGKTAVESEPMVSFTVEKKVGSATLHAYGHAGQERAAMKAVDAAAKRLRGRMK